ncbi:hypothetical protein SGRA_0793 [Saprospira grandis str. Lewin]|uniref:Uncharacterized protein n=1 Tax=Saprospira grandis (strain Lewin) TaxID=984262 RepID=H6L1Z4_SAPGL|nr:hypothetical protein SGRA_0793 [Saprospira grandis str. Lewin]
MAKGQTELLSAAKKAKGRASSEPQNVAPAEGRQQGYKPQFDD